MEHRPLSPEPQEHRLTIISSSTQNLSEDESSCIGQPSQEPSIDNALTRSDSVHSIRQEILSNTRRPGRISIADLPIKRWRMAQEVVDCIFSHLDDPRAVARLRFVSVQFARAGERYLFHQGCMKIGFSDRDVDRFKKICATPRLAKWIVKVHHNPDCIPPPSLSANQFRYEALEALRKLRQDHQAGANLPPDQPVIDFELLRRWERQTHGEWVNVYAALQQRAQETSRFADLNHNVLRDISRLPALRAMTFERRAALMSREDPIRFVLGYMPIVPALSDFMWFAASCGSNLKELRLMTFFWRYLLLPQAHLVETFGRFSVLEKLHIVMISGHDHLDVDEPELQECIDWLQTRSSPLPTMLGQLQHLVDFKFAFRVAGQKHRRGSSSWARKIGIGQVLPLSQCFVSLQRLELEGIHCRGRHLVQFLGEHSLTLSHLSLSEIDAVCRYSHIDGPEWWWTSWVTLAVHLRNSVALQSAHFEGDFVSVYNDDPVSGVRFLRWRVFRRSVNGNDLTTRMVERYLTGQVNHRPFRSANLLDMLLR